MKLGSPIRGVIAVLVLICLGSLAGHADAGAADTPNAFVNSLGQKVVHALSDPALSQEARLDKFEMLFEEGLDLTTIGRFVLGRYWRQATPAQRKTYEQLFKDYIVAIYAARLGRYQGETLRLIEARKDGEHDTVVTTEILAEGRPTTRVDWRVRGTSPNFKIIDVVVEGISMAITQRSEFASVIQRSGGQLEGLLSELRDKASKK